MRNRPDQTQGQAILKEDAQSPRNQIEYLEKELAEANETIQRQNEELLALYRKLAQRWDG